MIKFKLLNKDARLPERATSGAAGYDLVSVEGISLAPGAFHAVSTGLAIELPPGFEGQVRPRSGLAAKHGVTVLNAPGTIDEDYRGEVKVILINHGPGTFDIKPGMRIAQLVPSMTVSKLLKVELVDDFTPTDRGTGGFGSTGV